MMRFKNIKLKLILFVALVVVYINKSSAQISPLVSMYYQNQYMINPAMAGFDKGLNINANYKHELAGSKGEVATNALTIDYKLNKAGVGININMDRDGLVRTDKYAATYAYHLPVAENKDLHFGLSAGITSEKLNNSEIIGDMDDPLIMEYNSLEPSFDADLGVAYTSETLSGQFVLPNLRRVINSNNIDQIYTPITVFASVGYKLKGKIGELEPKIAYRGLRYYDSVIDAGLQFTTVKKDFNFLLFYHTTNNITAGLGFAIHKNNQLLFSYVSPINSVMQQYTYGNLQIGLKLNFISKWQKF